MNGMLLIPGLSDRRISLSALRRDRAKAAVNGSVLYYGRIAWNFLFEIEILISFTPWNYFRK